MKKTFFDYSISLFINNGKKITIDDITNNFMLFKTYGLLPNTFQVMDIATGKTIFLPQLNSADKKWQINITDQRIDVHYKPVNDFVTNKDECDSFIDQANKIFNIFFDEFHIKSNRIAFNSRVTINEKIDYKNYIVDNSSILCEKPIQWNIRVVHIKQCESEEINVINEVITGDGIGIPIGNSVKMLSGTMYTFDINTRQTNVSYRFNKETYTKIIKELNLIRKDILDKIWSEVDV